MKRRKGIILFFFSVLTILAFPQGYNFRTFSSGDGLVEPYVYSIVQDVNGYLWIGTGNGISRYNGFIFENYSTNDSLADNRITCSITDGEYLWFGHSNGRLSLHNEKRFQPVSVPKSISSPITHLAKSPDGQIWGSTYSDGLLKLSKDIGVVKHKLFKDKTIIITFDFLNEKEILVGTNTGLLYCRINDPGIIEIIRPVSDIPESKVTCIQKMRTRPGFYVTTENDGIFQLTQDGTRLNVLKMIADPDCDFTGIQDIFEDSQSNLWLSTFGYGLIRMRYSEARGLTKIDYYNRSNGFVTDNVKTLFEDIEGNIWSGNFNEGLTQITPKTFSVYPLDKKLYGNDIFALWFSPRYRWIGTENGLVKIDQLTGKIVKFYGKENGLAKDTVNTIYSADGNILWIGTEKNGLFRMETESEKIIKYPIGTGSLENSINIISGKGDKVWVGTKKGLCSINSNTNEINWFTINQGGLPHNYINCLFSDSKDRLWVSTRTNILSYIFNEKVTKIPVAGSGVLTLGPICEDSDFRIWVGSNGNGVFMIESDSIANLTVKEGLLSNYCYSLICDDNKNIWVGHKGGLSRIRTSDYSVKPIQHIEGITDSYQFNTNAIIKDQQGKTWFGSHKGIIFYDQSMEYPLLKPPVLGITSIVINNEESSVTDKIVLPPGNYKIKINFLGISLKEPELVTYQYRLDGFDQWSEITKNPFVTYNSLTNGDYTFMLNASSGDGVTSENPLTINIIIKIPIWKKWWFFPLMLLLLIIVTFIYVKRREYRFLAEKRILEEKVRERTWEIQCQKNEIELQRDLIDEKNTNITSSIKYASHIQNAVLPPMELVEKLLPDSFILSKPKDIVSGDFYWLAEKNDKIVFTVADCTGHGVPGAFMSLLGITLLNEIVNVEEITKSEAIVNKLRDRVINSLKQTRKDIPTTDGMDIALCVLDKQQKRIQYTGGMSNLVLIRDRKLEIVKADRLSVCALYDNSGSFTMKEFDYRKGDTVYLFSDGYQDQFGGDFDKKYLPQHFYLSLLEIHELPMLSQREVLEKKLNDWMKDKIQTDDITVMGVRL